jgi:hypothetical protein
MKANCKVNKTYKSAYPKPWIIKTGDQLRIGRRNDEWEGWVWCTDKNGQTRWVPEIYLKIEGDSATCLCDYDATELSVDIGDELVILKQAAEWAWCRKADGQEGWVPLENIEANQKI